MYSFPGVRVVWIFIIHEPRRHLQHHLQAVAEQSPGPAAYTARTSQGCQVSYTTCTHREEGRKRDDVDAGGGGDGGVTSTVVVVMVIVDDSVGVIVMVIVCLLQEGGWGLD